MFKISPIQDTEVQKKYAEACGIPCREGLFAYAMLDVDSLELMGMSQFEIGDGVGYIADLVPRVGYDDFDSLPQETTLQRSAVEFMKKGGKLRAGGIFIFDDEI